MMVNPTPRSLYPRERPDTHCTGGWVGLGPVWTGAKNLAPTGIRSPDRPARNKSLYRLCYVYNETGCFILYIGPNTYIAYTRNIPVAVLRILFEHSALIRDISHICRESLATDDHERIIRKPDDPAIITHLYVTGYKNYMWLQSVS